MDFWPHKAFCMESILQPDSPSSILRFVFFVYNIISDIIDFVIYYNICCVKNMCYSFPIFI